MVPWLRITKWAKKPWDRNPLFTLTRRMVGKASVVVGLLMLLAAVDAQCSCPNPTHNCQVGDHCYTTAAAQCVADGGILCGGRDGMASRCAAWLATPEAAGWKCNIRGIIELVRILAGRASNVADDAQIYNLCACTNVLANSAVGWWRLNIF